MGLYPKFFNKDSDSGIVIFIIVIIFSGKWLLALSSSYKYSAVML